MRKTRTKIPQKIREAVLKEYHHKCSVCDASEPAPELHHIDEDPSNHDSLNILPLCPNCHSSKLNSRILSVFRKYKSKEILSVQFEQLFKKAALIFDLSEDDYYPDCYRDGQGVAKDAAEAVNWFQKAADQNLAIAQYNLGVCYGAGQGVAKDDFEAVKWYRKAAEQNLAYAESNLGTCYEHGNGVAKDYEEAVKWYRKAAGQNYVIAEYDLAACYANGVGVEKDDVEAVKWYRKAAEQNYATAQCNLGVCYGTGQGVAKDYVEAYKWLNLALAQGDTLAKENLPTIESWMTREQIAEAQRLTREFKPRK